VLTKGTFIIQKLEFSTLQFCSNNYNSKQCSAGQNVHMDKHDTADRQHSFNTSSPIMQKCVTTTINHIHTFLCRRN